MDCDYNNKNSAPFPLEGNGAPASIAETAISSTAALGRSSRPIAILDTRSAGAS